MLPERSINLKRRLWSIKCVDIKLSFSAAIEFDLYQFNLLLCGHPGALAMAAKITFKLSLLLSFLSVSFLAVWSDTHQNAGTITPTCKRIECPSYDVIQVGNGYEIRRYNSTVWISNSPIQDISLVEATRTGFLRLFSFFLSFFFI